MQILVLSDIHDYIVNLNNLIGMVQDKVDAAVFCGDMCAPFSARLLSNLQVPTYCCLGNNDEDQIGLLKMGGPQMSWTHLSQEYGEVELDGRKIAFCHYPKLAGLLAKSGEYQAVFYGHTHTPHQENNQTLLLNPGSVCGIQGGKPGQASFGIYDSQLNQAEVINL